MDFVSDCVSTGKVIRMLTIVDDCTRECPAIEVDTSLGGFRVCVGIVPSGFLKDDLSSYDEFHAPGCNKGLFKIASGSLFQNF
jgi:hypothetical protein